MKVYHISFKAENIYSYNNYEEVGMIRIYQNG